MIATGQIGAAGGTVMAADGSVSFQVQAGVLNQNTTVTLVTSQPYARSGPQLVGNICELRLDPQPTAQLDPPPVLSFLNTTGNQTSHAVCQRRNIEGQPVAGSDPVPPNFFLPGEAFFDFDPQGHPQLELPLLRESQIFCTSSILNPSACQPTDQSLQAPPTPPGLVYVGREVLVNGVYVKGLSTVPIDRKHASTDQLAVRSETRTVDGSVDCDIVVVHVFAQPGTEVCPCKVPPEMLVPPPTPPGFRPVGHGVVKNFVLVESSGDLKRLGKETDINVIRSRTVVVNNVTECDIIVGFDFEQIVTGPPVRNDKFVDSSGGEVDLGDAAPICLTFPAGSLPAQTQVSLELVEPFPTDNTVFWPRVQITLNPNPPAPLVNPPTLHFKQVRSLDPIAIGCLQADPGNVQGQVDPHSRFLPQSSRENAGGGLSVALPVPGGTYAITKQKQCNPSAGALTPPPTPAGLKYLGREVVCDFVYQQTLSTLPLDRGPAPTDTIFIQSETVVVDGVACDIIVAHYFEPQANDQQCIPPANFLTPPAAPAGTRFVGFDASLNFKLVQTTVPLTRTEKSSDTNFVRSSSTVLPNGAVCDFIVRFLFEPL